MESLPGETINSHLHLYLKNQKCSKHLQSLESIVYPYEPTRKRRKTTMSVPPQWRECSWTKNSELNRSTKAECSPNNNLAIFPPSQPRPRARRGPIVPVDMEEIEDLRAFWQNCFIGVMMDIKKFLVRMVQ